jgi:hypothetical protein
VPTVWRKKLENVKYFNCLGSIMTNVARRRREIKSNVDLAKAAFNKKTPCTSKLDSYLRKELAKYYVKIIALYGAETRTLRKVDKKYVESFELWCWRRIEINWGDRVNNEV